MIDIQEGYYQYMSVPENNLGRADGNEDLSGDSSVGKEAAGGPPGPSIDGLSVYRRKICGWHVRRLASGRVLAQDYRCVRVAD